MRALNRHTTFYFPLKLRLVEIELHTDTHKRSGSCYAVYSTYSLNLFNSKLYGCQIDIVHRQRRQLPIESSFRLICAHPSQA